MRVICIGDVHGNTLNYQRALLLRKFQGQRTFQLGDMGLGFRGVPGLQEQYMSKGDHKFIRGNHDNPAECKLYPWYAGDYGYDETDGIFWLGGAFSIDYMGRIPGKSWWEDEELSYTELSKAIDLYIEKKPKYVLSHEAPARISEYLLTVVLPGFRGYKLDCMASRTAGALQEMLDTHRPVEWVFGHYHVNQSFEWRGTKFTCVNELCSYVLTDEPLIVEA